MIRSLNLPKVFSFINVPPSVQKLLKPMLVASIGLHVFALMAPLPSAQVKPKAPQPKTVKLATLPPIQKTTKSLSVSRLSAKPLLKSRLSNLPQKGLTLPRSAKQKFVAQNTARPSAAESAAQTAQPLNQAAQSDSSDPMSDFPHYPGATSGCLGLPSCFSIDQNFTAIAQFFEKQLPLKKFVIKSSINEPERKVYQISKGGVSQYLSVLSDGSTTEYVLAAEPQSQASLRNAVQIPAEFTTNILAKLPTDSGTDAGATGDIPPEEFSSPTAFFSELGGVGADGFDVSPERNAEIDSIKRVPSQTPQQVFGGSFSASLNQSGYLATPIAAGYGGGLLYEIKKGSFKSFYLNLVPTKSGTDTVVVVWLSNPS